MSSFLLDTRAFIWLTENDSNLPDNLKIIIDTADRVYLFLKMKPTIPPPKLSLMALDKAYTKLLPDKPFFYLKCGKELMLTDPLSIPSIICTRKRSLIINIDEGVEFPI